MLAGQVSVLVTTTYAMFAGRPEVRIAAVDGMKSSVADN